MARSMIARSGRTGDAVRTVRTGRQGATGMAAGSSAGRLGRAREGREMTARWQYDLESARTGAEQRERAMDEERTHREAERGLRESQFDRSMVQRADEFEQTHSRGLDQDTAIREERDRRFDLDDLRHFDALRQFDRSMDQRAEEFDKTHSRGVLQDVATEAERDRQFVLAVQRQQDAGDQFDRSMEQRATEFDTTSKDQASRTKLAEQEAILRGKMLTGEMESAPARAQAEADAKRQTRIEDLLKQRRDIQTKPRLKDREKALRQLDVQLQELGWSGGVSPSNAPRPGAPFRRR